MKIPASGSVAYIALDTEGNYLLAASYGEHLILTRDIEPSAVGGTVSQSVVSDVGHAHAILPSPDNRFIYYTSLAPDQVLWCNFDAATGTFSGHASVTLQTGSGPRHLRCSPRGEHVYVLNELTGTVAVLDRNEVTGSLQEKQAIGSVPPMSPVGQYDCGAGPMWIEFNQGPKTLSPDGAVSPLRQLT